MSRGDISEFLIHFTKGETIEDAFQRLRKIINEKCLLGGSETIKGRYPCVCFSEAPLTELSGGLVNPRLYSKYSPFGILVHKEWLFQNGGRPVIYGADDEFAALPESHRWRHMRYEPPEIDFTWEREWRVSRDRLEFDKGTASIVVPDGEWAKRLIDEHTVEQDYRVMEYTMIFDQMHAEQYREEFSWKLLPLK